MEENMLTLLGLEPRDLSVYKTLLKLGPSSVRNVAAESDINRGTTHEILNKLIKLNLVGKRPIGKSFNYQAESPQKILEIAKERKTSVDELIHRLTANIVPGLESLKVRSSKPNVSYYEDVVGVEKVLKDVLSTMEKTQEKEYYVFSAKPMRRYLYLYYPNFTKLRVKRKIYVKVIALGKGGDPAPLSERKWLHGSSSSDFLSYVIIYKDKLALISLTEDELPYSVVIQETGITQTMKFVFHSLWACL